MTFQCPSPTNAFAELSRVFSTRGDRVLEIEILPPTLGPFLQDEDSIGITKKYLVEAFVAARQVFFENLELNLQHGGLLSKTTTITSQAPTDDKLDSLPAITSEIILLFDCEHLTACNWRKRRLSALLHSHVDKDVLEHALTTELSLMTTYLCSPLHRHTKSPTLWQHRRWVVTRLAQLQRPRQQALRDLFKAELAVVLRAGELHPRNYYAFSHMRQVRRDLSDLGGESAEWTSLLARDVIDTTLDWCLAHPADISGWMFILYLLGAVPDDALRFDSVSKAVCFALNIGWEGESLWTFVDLAISSFDVVEFAEGTVQKSPWDVLLNSGLIEQAPQGTDGPRYLRNIWLDRARSYWAHTGQGTKDPHTSDNVACTHD